MAHEKTRSIVDVITNIAVAAAAIAIVWRVLSAPAPRPIDLTPAPGPTAAPIENLESNRLSTTLSNAARKGKAGAQVVLIEFSDYECPFCGRYARDTFEQIDKEFVENGKVQYVFRNFPLEDIHPAASKAGQAAECAGAQERYWEMHGRLFASQAELKDAVWLREARTLQLNIPSFERCMGGTMLSKVKTDIEEGKRLGVQATPTFFLGQAQNDGTVRLLSRVRGAHPYAVFRDALNQALKKG